ncbi:hypothetical protein GCM10022217_03810 [Chryseobacterium ginsenosidimutans]|uniref:hypothetical protein n=1 Tax=Chryseobacterium ginsenosidimutans TaxID=687846 RepID=UPI0031D86051
MKKKIFMGVFALSIFMISCNEDSNERSNDTTKTELTQKNASFLKLPEAEQKKLADVFFKSLAENKTADGKVRGFCQPVKATVGIGIFTVETTINICCTTLTMNCIPIPDIVIHKNSEGSIDEFEIIDSEIFENDEGRKFKIKEGIYNVSSGTFQPEIIEVK